MDVSELHLKENSLPDVPLVDPAQADRTRPQADPRDPRGWGRRIHACFRESSLATPTAQAAQAEQVKDEEDEEAARKWDLGRS